MKSHFKADAPRPTEHTDANFKKKKALDVQHGKDQIAVNKVRTAALKTKTQ